jgi:acyl-CoA synthetase (AMP-forming)/AMP-acid ligase II
MRDRAERHRDKVAFDYSPGAEEHSRLSYHELDIKARAIASTLQRQGAAGERVLVLCPSGLDFIAGLFWCIYAGAVAVPVHPPGFLDQVDQFDRFALVDAHACQRNQKQAVRQSKAGSALRMRAMAHCRHGGQRMVVPRSSR